MAERIYWRDFVPTEMVVGSRVVRAIKHNQDLAIASARLAEASFGVFLSLGGGNDQGCDDLPKEAIGLLQNPQDREQLELADALQTIAPRWMNFDIRRISAEWIGHLHPEELAIAKGFADARRIEFATGRASVRHLIRQLIPFDLPILVGERRAPMIPPGLHASISHCDSFAASVATKAACIMGLGVDIELRDRVTPDLADALLSPSEKARCKSEHPQQSLACYFSAKEAAFKAIHGLIGKYIDFLDIDLTMSSDCFLAQPLFFDSVLNNIVVEGHVTERGRHVVAIAWAASSSHSNPA